MDKATLQTRARAVFEPLVRTLVGLGVPPIMISLFGLAFAFYGAVVVSEGSLALGGLFLLIAGLCDILDGDVARRRNLVSRFGAFIDSSLDRVAEFAYFGGLLLYVVNRPEGFHNYEVMIVFAALAGSVLTSYARARAEGIGVDCTVGVLARPERVVLLSLGLLLGYHVLQIVLTVLAVASLYTFVQRVVHTHRRTARARAQTADGPPSS